MDLAVQEILSLLSFLSGIQILFVREYLKKASKAAIFLLLHLIIVSENEGKFGLFDGEA